MTRRRLSSATVSCRCQSTSDEHWRFTDLRGFDPESYAVDGADARSVADSMLEIDAAAVADATEGGIEIVSAPEGITFAPLADHERLGTLVGPEDKLTAHNAAVWQHGLLVHVPAGVELEKPLYVRVGNSTPQGSSSGAAGRRGGGLALHAHRGAGVDRPRARVLLERGRRGLRRARRQARVRLHPEPLPRDLAFRHAPRSRRRGRGARLGGGRLRLAQGQDHDREPPRRAPAPPRASPAPTSPTATHLDYDTLQEHEAPNTTSDFAFKGVLRDKATSVWRGMIKVERDAQRRTPTRRTATFCCLPTRTPTRSRASRYSRTTCAARTGRRSRR